MSHVRAGHWSFLVVPLLVGPLCACGMSTAKPHAEAAVAEFHKQMNAGDYHAIWNGADDELYSGLGIGLSITPRPIPGLPNPSTAVPRQL